MAIGIDMKNLSEDIIASYDLRVKAIGELVSDVRKTLNSFAADRERMSIEQAKDLSDFVKGLSTSVEQMLEEFKKDRKQMADNIKNSLQQGETDRLKDFESIMAEIRKVIKDSETDIKNKLKEFSAGVRETENLLKDYREEREKMATNWQTLTAKMSKKRGIKPRVEAEVKVRTVEEAVEEEKPPVEEAVEEEKPLEEKIVEFIERHPEGVRVGDMEEPVGIPRTRLGVIAKRLLEEGKIRKEENLYFPL